MPDLNSSSIQYNVNTSLKRTDIIALYPQTVCTQPKTTLQNEGILWNKDTSSGPKMFSSEHTTLWNKDTSELGTLSARPRAVPILQASLQQEGFYL
jgi:hypothetical protein